VKKLSFVLIFMALFSCTKNNQKNISLETNSDDNNVVLENMDI